MEFTMKASESLTCSSFGLVAKSFAARIEKVPLASLKSIKKGIGLPSHSFATLFIYSFTILRFYLMLLLVTFLKVQCRISELSLQNSTSISARCLFKKIIFISCVNLQLYFLSKHLTHITIFI